MTSFGATLTGTVTSTAHVIPDTTETRRHCVDCDCEWYGPAGCWICNRPGDVGNTPTGEDLPSMASTRGMFDGASVSPDETFRL